MLAAFRSSVWNVVESAWGAVVGPSGGTQQTDGAIIAGSLTTNTIDYGGSDIHRRITRIFNGDPSDGLGIGTTSAFFGPVVQEWRSDYDLSAIDAQVINPHHTQEIPSHLRMSHDIFGRLLLRQEFYVTVYPERPFLWSATTI